MTTRTARLSCGCRHTVGDRERWVEMCPEHKAETDALHKAALRHQRVISGTGNASEQRELAALCRWLKETA